MTQIGTKFKVTDNSGVKTILAITNLSRNSKKIYIGDLIVGIIKNIHSSKKKLFFSDIVYGIVVRLKKTLYTNIYNYSFNDNSVVLVDKSLNPLGSRIFGSLPYKLKQKNCLKLNSLTVDII